MTEQQTTAIRSCIRSLGQPSRETTLPDGTRRYEFRTGTTTLIRWISPDGSIESGVAGR